MSRILVTGATGYIGGRLVPLLLDAGHSVRVLARHPERLRDRSWFDRVEVIAGDAGDPAAVGTALDGVDVAYYLLHSLQRGDELEREERRVATVFADGARANAVGRIIYLGGLAPADAERGASAHMRSRVEVGRILAGSGVPTIELRASVIIGSGSASFEMLRYLTERLPAMVTPRWVRQRTQPIAVRDVLRYLALAADLPPDVSGIFDIGGPDVLTYEEMMRRYAAVAGLGRRIIWPINVLTPSLSRHWVGLVTPVPRSLARPLVESLRHPAICRDDRIRALIPDPPEGLLPFDRAVELALARVRDRDVTTRWSSASYPGAPSEPLPSDPDWSGGTIYTDVRTVETTCTPQQVWRSVDRIGGSHGWKSARLLWEIRGAMDRVVGGVGLRRGRRDPERLRVGDAVDFWRVEERIPPHLLRLRAEMKMPGLAWLEFTIDPTESGARLTQRALFVPRGLSGHAYWWSVAPFHRFVFPAMARHTVDEAKRLPALAPDQPTPSARPGPAG